jgi:hypothetical protein
MPLDHRRALDLLFEAQVFAPAIVPGRGLGGFFVFSGAKELGRGDTLEDAIEDARAKGNILDLPARPMFRSVGKDVLRRGEVVAQCSSYTVASRIAHALNQYNPNERGI